MISLNRFLLFFLLVFTISFSLAWTPTSNINGQNYYNISNVPVVNATTYYGDGSQLTGIVAGNTSFNQSLTDSLYAGIEWDYNQTLAAVNILNGTGLIKNWNASSLIINWNNTGYIINWNQTGYIRNWNNEITSSNTSLYNWVTGQNYLTSFTETDPKWSGNYSTFLTHITWGQATNGTLALTSDLSNYYPRSNPNGFYNSTTLPNLNSTGLIINWTILDKDTTYSAGQDLQLTGTTFSTNRTSLKGYFDVIYQSISGAFSGAWSDLTGKPDRLSNFTDDLGNRGYNNLLNFTNGPGYVTNSTMNKTVSWVDISGYPVACPAGTYVTQVGDSIICSSAVVSETDPLWSANQSLYSKITDLVSYVGNWTLDKTSYSTTNAANLLYKSIGVETWNSTYSAVNKTYFDTLYYALNNPYAYYNSTNPSPTYNSTYDAYNSTGLIKDWNSTGYIKNWNSSGFITNQSQDLSGYYLKTNPYSFYNSTTLGGIVNTSYYVPYTGANANVDLGNNTITSSKLLIHIAQPTGTCLEGMAYIDKFGGYCIDKFEASTPGCEVVGNNCGNYTSALYCPTICIPDAGVLGGVDSTTGTTAVAYSKQNVAPLVGVSQKQARQMCANAGKHLCTDEEWLGAANVQGQVFNLPSDLRVSPYFCVTGSDTYCNYAGNSNKACNTSKYVSGTSGCNSSEGVYDMVGNVYEWTNNVADIVINPLTNATGGLAGGYYINTTSLNWSTSSTADNGKYGKDYTYFPANTTNKAVARGGPWYFGGDAGPFCANLGYAPSDVDYNLGFRCCSL